MTATRIGKLATLAASAGVGIAAAALLWRTRVPTDLRLPHVAPADYFPRAELARIEEYRRPARALVVASLAVQVVVVGAAAWKAGPLAAAVTRVARGRLRAGVALGVLVVVAVTVAQAPLAAIAHAQRRRYGLSEQAYVGWARDQVVSLAIVAVLTAIAVTAALLLAERFGRRWWIPAVPALTAIALLLVVVQPYVISPLFNRFEPIPDRELARRIQTLARRMGVEIETVQVADASRRTTTGNAYVAGLGPSRRVVLYDNVLRDVPEDELLALSAHELAHVGRRHLWKGVAWFALLAVPGAYVVARVSGRVGTGAEPAVVPVGLAAALGFVLLTLPLQNAASRRYEAEADWLALEATRDPDSVIALDRRLVLENLADPDPPALLTFWLGTHPPSIKRIAMARAWATTRGRAAGSPAGS